MPQNGRSRAKVEKASPILAEIQRELDEEVDLAILAERFGYSPHHFHRLFTDSVGETPRDHMARLRLEKAFLLVVVSKSSFLDIALTVGFQNHETFTRAFKRQFGMTPRELRNRAREQERRPLERNGEDYTLSEVRFVSLPPKHMLAIRHIGSYDEPFQPPYVDGDVYWTKLLEWAEANNVGHDPLAYGFFLDMPGITPDETMRADFCIETAGRIEPQSPLFYRHFEGGSFGVIEHRGPYSTLPLAYRALVNAIFAVPAKWTLNGMPPFQILHQTWIEGDRDRNVSEVYFPVDKAG